MRVFIVSEKSFEISQIRSYFEKLPFDDYDDSHRLDFYQEESNKAGIERYNKEAEKSFAFDLIIISYKMKPLNGLQLAKSIFQKKGLPAPPMVLITDMMSREMVEEAGKCGVHGFLKVPYNLEQFKESLSSLTETLVAREEKKLLDAVKAAKEKGATINLSNFIEEASKKIVSDINKLRIYAPWNSRPYISMSKLLVGAGDYKTPVPLLRTALKIDFGLKDAHKLLQTCYRKSGMHKEEFSELKKLLATDPRSATINVKVGNAMLREGHFQKAAEFFQRAITNHKPTDPTRVKAKSHWGLGTSCMNMDKDGDNKELQEKAKENLNRAVTVDPTLVSAYFNLIAVYKKLGLEDQAKTIMKKAVAITPNTPEDWLDLFFFYLNDGELEKAKFALNKSIAMDADNPLTLFLAGEALIKNRYFKDAVAYLEKSLAIYPSDTRTYNFLGICYRNLNNLDKSADYYSQALKIDPEDCNVYYNLGKVYMLKKDFAKAKSSFEKAYSINPELVEAKDGIAQAAKGGA